VDVVFQFEQVALYLFLRTVAPDLDNVVVVLVFFLRPAVLPTAFIYHCSPFGRRPGKSFTGLGHVETLTVFLIFKWYLDL